MKKYSKKFLNKKLLKSADGFERNQERALKVLGIPKKLWEELSKHHTLLFSISKGRVELPIKINTAFLAGFIVGWAEKSSEKFN